VKNDGTWQTAVGFPVKLSNVGSGGTGIGDWGETILPLSNQKSYVLFGHGESYLNGTGSSPILGELYTSGFGPVENATSSPLFANMAFSSAVTVADNVFLVFLAPNPQTNMVDVKFVERVASSGTWTAETTVWPSLSGTTFGTFGYNALALSKDSAGNLYLFWMGAPTVNHIYYMKYTAATGTWDNSPTDWITETSIQNNGQLMVYPQAYDGNLGMIYEAGTKSPYNIRSALFLSNVTTTSTTSLTSVTTSSTAESVTMTVSYSILGGGTPTAPDFNYVQGGVAKSLPLTGTPTAVSVDKGSTWSVTPNPLANSGSSQQWISSQSLSGTASSTTIEFVFQHQYYLTVHVSPVGGGTVTPKSEWVDAAQSITLTATPNSARKFRSWSGRGTGSYSGTRNPTTITMNSAITETANFT
jgi:hypothetical protein